MRNESFHNLLSLTAEIARSVAPVKAPTEKIPVNLNKICKIARSLSVRYACSKTNSLASDPAYLARTRLLQQTAESYAAGIGCLLEHDIHNGKWPVIIKFNDHVRRIG